MYIIIDVFKMLFPLELKTTKSNSFVSFDEFTTESLFSKIESMENVNSLTEICYTGFLLN